MHYDKKDYKQGLGMLVPFGDYTGSIQYPELRVEAHLQPGDIAVFQTANLLHGNSGVTGDRHSLAFFCYNTAFHPVLDDCPLYPEVTEYHLNEKKKRQKKAKKKSAEARVPSKDGHSLPRRSGRHANKTKH
jgi:hypothetical protein